MRRRLILDVDTGTDDAIALMCAVLHPDLELLAATTVNGNVAVDDATANTLAVLDHIGAAVPVHAGAAAPIDRSDLPLPRASWPKQRTAIHPRALEIPRPSSLRAQQRAVEFIVSHYADPAHSDTILVAVAPLSNVASALRREPRLAQRIPELVLMGGSHEIPNVTPSAEFNMWADPEAAREVLHAGIPIRMIPLDATHRAQVPLEACKRLRRTNTPAAQAAASFIERRIHALAEGGRGQPEAAPVHDALALLSVAEPGLLRDVRSIHVDVETRDELTLGRTVCDVDGRSREAPNCSVALDADGPDFIELLIETLGRAVAA